MIDGNTTATTVKSHLFLVVDMKCPIPITRAFENGILVWSLAKGEDTFTQVTKNFNQNYPVGTHLLRCDDLTTYYYHILQLAHSRGLQKPRDIGGSKISSVAHSQIDYCISFD